MAVIERLTEDECYLAAILQDDSGLDLAEFTWYDPERADGCWRAWSFQWSWFRCADPLQIDQCARAVGKSQSIALRAFAFPFIHPGQEMVITAPEKVHLDAITDKIETQITSTRLTRELLQGGRGSIKHQPFHCNFANGSRIMGRIPQRDGKGVKGCAEVSTPITTSSGVKRAGDVVVGDLIWTHQGWRAVEHVLRDTADTCYEINGQGGFPVTVSWDHRFYGASNLADAKHKRDFSEGLWWGITEDLVADQFYWATPTEFDELPVPDPNDGPGVNYLPHDRDEFWWLVGRYLADGHLSTGNKVCFTAHPKDQAEITSRIERCGLGWHRTVRPHSTADMLSVCSVSWNRWLLEHFAHHADGKNIPGWALGMTEAHRRNLLEGYLSGDGSWSESKGRWTVATASEFLACGLQLLAQSLGQKCSGHYIATPRVTHINGVALKAEPKPSFRFHVYPGGRGKAAAVDGYLLGKVKSVDNVGEREVVNIITDAHSYLSGSVVSHNTHPIWLEMDEAQDYPKPGWTELIETLKRGHGGAVWRAHGVTRGVRDEFYKYTRPDSGWTTHHFTAMHRPTWTDQERTEKIDQYGSKDAPDYRRNILGLHGDATQPLFVLHRLMRCVDSNEVSDYNQCEYFNTRINAEMLAEMQCDPVFLLDFPASHKADPWKFHWIGMDVGYTVDPTEILVFGELSKNKKSTLQLLARVHLERVSHHDQVRTILWMLDYYKPKIFAMDKTGLGLPLFQDIQGHAPHHLDRIKGYNFSEKILVDFDQGVVVDEYTGDAVKEAGIKRNVREYAQDCLRELVDSERLILPWDKNLIAQFEGGTQTQVSGYDQYGRRRIFSGGEDHALDAARMAALGYKQWAIDELLKIEQEPIFDSFLFDDRI